MRHKPHLWACPDIRKERQILKFPKEVEEDLLKEVQRLRAENAYLKKLQALVLEEARHKSKKQK